MFSVTNNNSPGACPGARLHPWKLVISDARGIAISAMWWPNRAGCLPLRPIVKCETNLHNGTLTHSEQNSLSGHYQVSSRSSVIKCRSGRSRAHLVVSTDRVSFWGCCRINCKFYISLAMHLIGSPHDYVLIVILRTSLITSFQPPLPPPQSLCYLLITV